MKTNNKTAKAIRTMCAGLLAVAMGAPLALSGCSTGGGSSNAGSTAAWPSATPPPTTQANTYIGTQSPGWTTVTIDHTKNTYSYQNLSTQTAVVSGTFTTAANGVLVLSNGGFALEQLSRAVVLSPGIACTTTPFNGLPDIACNAVFAVAAPSCQMIPDRTQFDYIGMATPYYGTNPVEASVNAGLVGASSDTTGANWTFGGQTQYVIASPVDTTIYPVPPDPFSATCSTGSGGTAVIASIITEPTSIPVNLAIGPTGYFVEDRYQNSFTGNYGTSFIGAVKPLSSVDLSSLSGAAFLGINGSGGVGSSGTPSLSAPQLLSVASSKDKAGTSIELTGGAFPSNDPTQAPTATSFTIDLGPQDPVNYGYFPSATYLNTGSMSAGIPAPAYALVTQVGGKYCVFVVAATQSNFSSSFTFFQQ